MDWLFTFMPFIFGVSVAILNRLFSKSDTYEPETWPYLQFLTVSDLKWLQFHLDLGREGTSYRGEMGIFYRAVEDQYDKLNPITPTSHDFITGSCILSTLQG